MTGSSLAGVITATATVITAFGGLILALSVFIPNLRRTKATEAAVHEVHTMVNQQRTDALRYQRALIHSLHAAGIAVPIDQSLEPGE